MTFTDFIFDSIVDFYLFIVNQVRIGKLPRESIGLVLDCLLQFIQLTDSFIYKEALECTSEN